jgi:hypothetical protein
MLKGEGRQSSRGKPLLAAFGFDAWPACSALELDIQLRSPSTFLVLVASPSRNPHSITPRAVYRDYNFTH